LEKDCPLGPPNAAQKKEESPFLGTGFPLLEGQEGGYLLDPDNQANQDALERMRYGPVNVDAYVVKCHAAFEKLKSEKEVVDTTLEVFTTELVEYLVHATLVKVWSSQFYSGHGLAARDVSGLDLKPADFKRLFGISDGDTGVCETFAKIAGEFLAPREVIVEGEVIRVVPLLLLENDIIPAFFFV